MKKVFLLFLSSIFTSCLFSQIIPANMRVDWSHAGLQGAVPNPQTILDVTDYGAHPNDTIDDLDAVISAMNALNSNAGVLYFPSGTFMFSSTLYLADSVILRGANSDSTTLQFDLGNAGDDAIRIWRAQTGTFVDVLSGYQKESDQLAVADASLFSVGDYVELKETNGVWNSVPASWAVDCVGQIMKITGITGDTLFLDEPLRIDYTDSLDPQIRVYTPVSNVGIECLKIVRADSNAPSTAYNISFLGAANCWVNGVESDHSIGAHIAADLSTHLHISGCYFHHAYVYDGTSTHGYGVMLIQHTGDCLIENNFFRHLRHAMMVKQGANGNVFAYNYSIEPTRTEFPTNACGDMNVHGHYPFANLFEGNIAQNLFIDQTWGPGGPYNTFFRNREDLYGIVMTQGNITTDKTNFVGNEITNSSFPYGQYVISGSDNFLYGNNRQGTIDPAGTDSLPDESYFYPSLPDFWNGAIVYPPIGIPNTISTNSIPAKERYVNGEQVTQCGLQIATANDDQWGKEEIGLSVFPNPFTSQIHIALSPAVNVPTNGCEVITIDLFNLEGRKVFSQTTLSSLQNEFKISFPDNLQQGFYLLQVMTTEVNAVMKVIKD